MSTQEMLGVSLTNEVLFLSTVQDSLFIFSEQSSCYVFQNGLEINKPFHHTKQIKCNFEKQ